MLICQACESVNGGTASVCFSCGARLRKRLLSRLGSVLHRRSSAGHDPAGAAQSKSRGNAYLEHGDYERAVEAFDEAIRLDPRDAEAYYLRGSAYSYLGRFKRALEDGSAAILLDPTDASSHNERGAGHLNEGRYRRALEEYEEAIRLDPERASAYAGRAIAGALLGNPGAGLDAQRAIELGFDARFIEEMVTEARQAARG